MNVFKTGLFAILLIIQASYALAMNTVGENNHDLDTESMVIDEPTDISMDLDEQADDSMDLV